MGVSRMKNQVATQFNHSKLQLMHSCTLIFPIPTKDLEDSKLNHPKLSYDSTPYMCMRAENIKTA